MTWTVSHSFIYTREVEVESFMEVKTDTKALVFQLPFALHRIPHSFSGLQPT